MAGDTYSRIVSVIRGESSERNRAGDSQNAGLGASPVRMRLGVVTQRVPLEVRIAGIEQPTEVFYINERLARGAIWKAKIGSPASDYRGLSGALGGPVSCAGGCGSPRLGSVETGALHSEDSVLDEATVEQLEIDLQVDDQVLLLTEDDQVFFIIMKVVRAV